ncbi:hypothetical protein [Peptostreptococcus russellii]|uniref:Uncharacterized protein n=1 Tax=Peptostreptococcus russellii TaxID=215200 RepID=A0A1H8EVS6_9FIRM|nr:hypothetical protein [Peptostreptococcus russellii]SEN23234.1 hypothetical protein SAMN05216454_101255 [Peptostreptococcus russellii]
MVKIKTRQKQLQREDQKTKFRKFVENHVHDFVEISSYISGSKLYGVISECDHVSLTLTITYLDEENPNYNETESLHIPINSIKYIKKL